MCRGLALWSRGSPSSTARAHIRRDMLVSRPLSQAPDSELLLTSRHVKKSFVSLDAVANLCFDMFSSWRTYYSAVLGARNLERPPFWYVCTLETYVAKLA